MNSVLYINDLNWFSGAISDFSKAECVDLVPELQAGYGRVEAEVSSIASISTKPQICANDLHATAPTIVAAFNEDAQGNKKCLLKWKGPKKINRIYGDWLDDLPLAHNIPSRVES